VDGEPFGHVVDALDALAEDGTLVLVNDFEPVPLYAVLERRGFEHRARRAGPDEWRVVVERA
jgi:uncharacterized protein (DUF2249 family)